MFNNYQNNRVFQEPNGLYLDSILSSGVPQRSSSATKAGLEAAIFQALAAEESFLPAGTNVAFAISSEEMPEYTLMADEERALSACAGRRRRQRFARGRSAVHLALARLGIQKSCPILRGRSGEPLWPPGIMGSISHCDPWSVAVVANGPSPLFIGVDLENVRCVNEIDITELICSEKELTWVNASNDFGRRLAVTFSAKEAAYKAFYRACKSYIDFKEVALSPLADEQCLRGEFLAAFNDRISSGDTFQVRYCWYNNLVFSYVIHIEK